jgi:Fic family protein
MPFEPKFSITPKVATSLMRIEAARQAVQDLPITPSVLATLRETARLYSTHYSTMIEGNRLTQGQVSKVIEEQQHFPGRERDEKEVLGYYAALEKVEQVAASGTSVSETHIQTLHGLVMAEGRKRSKPTPYRDGKMSSGTAALAAWFICRQKPKMCRR